MSLKKKKKYLLYVLLFSLILFIPQQKILGEDDEMDNEKIYQWVNQINRIESVNSLFTEVLNSDLQLVYYSIKNNYLGYIIINKNEEILEYGEGAKIPYRSNLIINTDIQKYELSNLVYFSPIENYWDLNTTMGRIFVEGSSGEWLPDLSMTPNRELGCETVKLNDKINDYYINKKLKFDPYENLMWLVDSEMQQPLTKSELKNLLKSDKKIIFVGKKYNYDADFAYSIIGYHTFEDKLFVATYDSFFNTIRFISYNDLINYGNFSLLTE